MRKSSFKVELGRCKLTKSGVLGCIFKTDDHKYFYDVISSKILKIKNILYDILGALTGSAEGIRLKGVYELSKKYDKKKIIECLSDIENHKKQEGLFSNIPDDFRFTLMDKGSELPNYNQIILEITQNCNFRCRYCAFSGNYKYERRHRNINMTEEIAFEALEFFFKNADKTIRPLVIFYGGEPLTNKELIRKCVDYARNKNPVARFSIQTNGYLLDREFLKYIYENRFKISVSIDGPKEIHDRCRTLPPGGGTYDKIISNLSHLYEIDKDYYKENVSISYTYGTMNHFQKLFNFHNNHPLMRGLRLNLNYISTIGLDDHVNYFEMIKAPIDGSRDVADILDEAFWKYVKDMSDNIRFEEVLFTRKLMDIIYRRPVNGSEFLLKGPCSLGRLKLFVSAEGGYKVCDKTSRLPFIGNVKEGMNWSYIKELENNLLENCKDCYKCWAMSLCGICWVHLFSSGPEIDIETKWRYCQNYKMGYLESLKRYAQIIEYDPGVLEKLESEYRKNTTN